MNMILFKKIKTEKKKRQKAVSEHYYLLYMIIHRQQIFLEI